MVYQEYKPHPYLSGYIECYWSAFAERPLFHEQETLIPDGTIELMFNFGDHYFQILNGKGRAIFDALANGGKVNHPYEKQFWGDWHGNLTDKYGIRWMVNCDSA